MESILGPMHVKSNLLLEHQFRLSKTSEALITDTNEKSEEETQKAVRCKTCNFEVTDPSFAVEPHEHTFRNPAGYSFHLICYSSAPGASEAGEATKEATWFAGYAWTFAICSNCHNHLGWFYRGDKSFVGLIATRVLR